MCVCVHTCVNVCMFVNEREKEILCVMCVCVYVCKRERKKDIICNVCVFGRGKEKEKKSKIRERIKFHVTVTPIQRETKIEL